MMFRIEAIKNAQTSTEGSILLVQPLRRTVLVWLLVGICVLIIVFLYAASITRKVQLKGVLLPEDGLLRVVSPQAGIVSTRVAKEELLVEGGDALFTIRDDKFSPRFGNASASVSESIQFRKESLDADRQRQNLQTEQKIAALHVRVAELVDIEKALDEQVELQTNRVELAAEDLERYEDLYTKNFVSVTQVELRRTGRLDQVQRLIELRRQRVAAGQEVRAAKSEILNLKTQMKRDDETAFRAIAGLAENLAEHEARREWIVRASRAGRVTAVNVDLGQTVTDGQVLASIVPSGSQLEAELYASTKSIGLVTVGSEVQIRFHAFPYEKFGQFRGVVQQVTSSAFPASELKYGGPDGGLKDDAEPVYRVRVRLGEQAVHASGISHPLRAGMTLEATVVLERRRLYEWILGPIYMLDGRL